MRLDLLATIIGASVLAAVVVVGYVARPMQVTALEDAVFDQFQRWHPRPFDPDGPVIFIDIDEETLGALGQWPWPRTYHAELIRRLHNAGAAAIAFDMLFAEPDRTSPSELARTLPRFGFEYGGLFEREGIDVPDHDEMLARMIGASRVILGTVASDTAAAGDRLPPRPSGIAVSGDGGDPTATLEQFSGAVPNLAALGEQALGIGVIVLGKTEGTVVRRVPLFVAIDGIPYPALSLEALRVALGAPSHLLKTTRGSGEADFGAQAAISSTVVAGIEVPLDARGRFRVWYSRGSQDRTLPAHLVLEGEELAPELAERIAGRIAIVGVSAAGVFDVKTTPLHPRIAGSHVHAEVIEQIAAEQFLAEPDWAAGAGLIATVLAGAAIVLSLALGAPLVAAALVTCSLAAICGGSWWLFVERGLLASPVVPAAGVLLPYFVISGYNYIRTERRRQALRAQFANFVPADIAERIARDPGRILTPEGVERELTILFLDMRGFSTLTENMTPAEVVRLVNDVLTPVSDAILAARGTIDKYIGDAVMAFWNAPAEAADHPARAVRTILEIASIVDRLNGDYAARGFPEVGVGIGVNTGPCAVGNFGTARRLSYSCVGDAVNLAARLEALTRRYAVGNIVGSETAKRIEGEFALIELDRIRVKGRHQPECISTVIGPAALRQDPRFAPLSSAIAVARACCDEPDLDAAERAIARVGEIGSLGLFDAAAYSAAMREWLATLRAQDRSGAVAAPG